MKAVTKPCKRDGCPNPVRGHGWCSECRDRWKATGNPAPIPVVPVPTAAARRCGCCGQVFAVLVDDVLCIRCDAILYPGLGAAS